MLEPDRSVFVCVQVFIGIDSSDGCLRKRGLNAATKNYYRISFTLEVQFAASLYIVYFVFLHEVNIINWNGDKLQ